MRILILGGTTEASRLAAALSQRSDIAAVLSYAGRTEVPAVQPIPTRTGGFGGIDGLATYLRDECIDLLIDATHPFAARISGNAAAASRLAGKRIFAFSRAPWVATSDDRWTMAPDNGGVLAAIGSTPRRVFLTIGRLGVGDFRHGAAHHYVIRTIDPPPSEDLPVDHTLILARGQFTVEAEIALMREHAIDVLVTKNSGGMASFGKIAAARALGLPVILVTPPQRPDVPLVTTLEDALAWIDAHGSVT